MNSKIYDFEILCPETKIQKILSDALVLNTLSNDESTETLYFFDGIFVEVIINHKMQRITGIAPVISSIGLKKYFWYYLE